MANEIKKRNKIVDVSGKKVEVPEQPLSVSSNGVYGQYLNAGKPSVNAPIYGNMLSGTMSNEQTPTQPVSNTGESTPTQSTETPVTEDNTQNGTYAEGIGASVDNGGVSTEEKNAPMTYESWINEQKQIEDQKYANALKEAEKYRERASADAQASYLQNMSTYGINAETMAKMGLTGGGYSDYLNSKAYAQQRADMQAAEKNALAMEKQANTTYQDAIAQLNQESTTAYNRLLENLQGAQTYGNYNEEGIRAMAKQFGWSDAQTQEAVDVWKKTKDSADLAIRENEGGFTASDWITAIRDSESLVKDEAGNEYTRDELYSMLSSAVNNKWITDDDVNKIMQAYDWRKMRDEGRISNEDFIKAMDGDEIAIAHLDETLNKKNTATPQGYKNKATELISEKYGEMSVITDGIGEPVDIFKTNSFGDFQNNKKQTDYTNKIIADAKAGKIEIGQLVKTNYGATASGYEGWYIYAGDGVFVPLNKPTIKQEQQRDKYAYVPEGYKLNGNGNIRRD
jgi:hypothetical protein